MTFRQMRLSLLLLAEERVGARRYRAALAARENEDAVASMMAQEAGRTP